MRIKKRKPPTVMGIDEPDDPQPPDAKSPPPAEGRRPVDASVPGAQGARRPASKRDSR